MKILTFLPCLLAVGLAACSSTSAPKQSVSDWGENPMENPEFMQAMTEYMTPGEEHELLARRAGSWNVRTKMFMTPDAEAVDMDATADSRMILGGRFLLEEFRGTLMEEPFEGMLVFGYNKLSDEFFGLWMDTWGTAVHSSSGTRGEDGAIRMVGSMKDVLTPEGRAWRHVIRDEGSGFVVELYDTLPDGTEWMVMHLTYTRRSDA